MMSLPLAIEPPAVPPQPGDTVITQNPEPGSSTSRNTRISVTFGQARDVPGKSGITVAVPELAGKAVTTARSDLERVGLALKPSEPPPADIDVAQKDQNPSAGIEVARGTAVSVSFRPPRRCHGRGAGRGEPVGGGREE